MCQVIRAHRALYERHINETDGKHRQRLRTPLRGSNRGRPAIPNRAVRDGRGSANESGGRVRAARSAACLCRHSEPPLTSAPVLWGPRTANIEVRQSGLEHGTAQSTIRNKIRNVFRILKNDLVVSNRCGGNHKSTPSAISIDFIEQFSIFHRMT